MNALAHDTTNQQFVFVSEGTIPLKSGQYVYQNLIGTLSGLDEKTPWKLKETQEYSRLCFQSGIYDPREE